MPKYIEYDLGDGASVFVEAVDDSEDTVIHQASRGKVEAVSQKAKKTFAEAIKDVKVQARLLLIEIESLHVNEAEVKFGLTTMGEMGNIAIGKIGMGINYEITLKWTRPTDQAGKSR